MKRKGFPIRGTFAGAVVVLGVVAWWWCVSPVEREAARPSERTEPTLIKEVTPSPPPRPMQASEESAEAKERVQAVPATEEDDECRQAAARRRAHEIMWAKKLKTDKRLQHYLKNFKPVQQDFGTGTEQMLDWIFNCNVGDHPPPPIPPLSEFDLAHIDEILDSVNEIKDTDGEVLARRKQVVDEVKKDLKDYLATGGTVREFLDHYHAELVKAWEAKEMARQSVEQVMQEGDNDMSKAYLQKVNKLLDLQGVPPIELTEEEKEGLGQ